MRLSEAILIGRVTVPEMREGDIEACAITMAVKATGDMDSWGRYQALFQRWPWTTAYFGKCPQCDWLLNSFSVVYHPFDNHVMGDRTMTLEQLCDWIRTIEPADEPAPAPEVAEREIVSVEP